MSTAMPILETDRLIVRPLATYDLEPVNAVLNGAWGESSTVDEREPWLRWQMAAYAGLAGLMQPPYGDRAIALRESGTIVGVVGLVPSFGPFRTLDSFGAGRTAGDRLFEPAMGLYWAVGPAHQGKGYATEAAGAVIRFAFEALSLRVIVATTEHENLRSLAVMRKLGMTINRNPFGQPEWFQAVGVLFHDAGTGPRA